MIKTVLLVAIGGGIGAILRELLMLAIGSAQDGFPLDILVANLTASFLLGLACALHARKALGDAIYLLLGTGVMGGLSTFSSFVFAAARLSERSADEALVAAAYVLLSLGLGFGAVLLGLRVGRGRLRAT